MFCTYGHGYMCLRVNTGNVGVTEIAKREVTEGDAWQIVYWLWSKTRVVVPSKAMDEVDRFFDVIDVDPSLQYSLNSTGVVVGPMGNHAHGCDCMDCGAERGAVEEDVHEYGCPCWDCRDADDEAREQDMAELELEEEEDRYADAALTEPGFRNDRNLEASFAARRRALGMPPRGGR